LGQPEARTLYSQTKTPLPTCIQSVCAADEPDHIRERKRWVKLFIQSTRSQPRSLIEDAKNSNTLHEIIDPIMFPQIEKQTSANGRGDYQVAQNRGLWKMLTLWKRPGRIYHRRILSKHLACEMLTLSSYYRCRAQATSTLYSDTGNCINTSLTIHSLVKSI